MKDVIKNSQSSCLSSLEVRIVVEITNQISNKLKVFKITEREETAEEQEAREQREAEEEANKKGGKKKPKKGQEEEEEEEEVAHMIKVCQMSNIDLSDNKLPVYSRWIGSIL